MSNNRKWSIICFVQHITFTFIGGRNFSYFPIVQDKALASTKCIDDALLWSDSIADSFHQAVQWLDVCGRNGITLNPGKFVFSSPVVDFAGFTITMDSVLPSPKYSDAILNFPVPSNIHDIRSWFGLVNQVSYAFSMAERMLPFRALLKAGQQFRWDTELQEIFDESKEQIVQEIEIGVRIFDKSKSRERMPVLTHTPHPTRHRK